MRIDAEAGEREFRHIGAAHRHKAGGGHALHDRCVRRGGRRIGQRARTRRRRLAGDIEQILQGDRNAGITAGRAAGPAQRIHRVGHGARPVRIGLDEGARALARRIGDAGQAFLGQRAARRLPFGEGVGGLLERAHDGLDVPVGDDAGGSNMP